MPEKPDLTALIGSRICHDLISPIGAIGNGVELLVMDGGGNSPEIALISESVANANALIRFFRIAFGGAGGDQRIARTEVAAILADMLRGGRLSIDWQSEADLARRDVKLAFLLIQCLESAMPFGGRMRAEQGAGRWTLSGTAHRMKIDQGLWEVLTTPAPPADIGAAQVQFALAAEEFRRQHRRLGVQLQEGQIRMEF
jgi:histidine phosphotransferase ChpT